MNLRTPNSKLRTPNFLTGFLSLLLVVSWELGVGSMPSFAQSPQELEINLDINSGTTPLPKIFKPGIDLSGRGLHRDFIWPQELAAPEVLGLWQKDIGFSGVYRMQYNLWDINQLSKNRILQNKLLANYEKVIKEISDSGGTVILDIFGTPAGLGRILDKRSPPWDLKAFKAVAKDTMRSLSCQNKYNIWYEVWNAPDLDDFFLGRKQEYLTLYRAIAEAAKELGQETGVHIPVGGPSVSWWFQNVDGNNVLTPERSLIYDLIKFCYQYHLPLDFISWHGYSTSPEAEKEYTIYKNNAADLIRKWLTYFRLDPATPLVVDEWNYDRGANLLTERDEKANIAASYIISRIKNMSEAGLDYQAYFCLEDFKNNREGVVRNVGVFSFDAESSVYKGQPKCIYNVFKMLNNLGGQIYALKLNDSFIGAIATKGEGKIVLLVYNYIDPDIASNYLSARISTLNPGARKMLLGVLSSDKLEKIMTGQLDMASLRTDHKAEGLLKNAQELFALAKKFSSEPRAVKVKIENLKDNYTYQRYALDSSCVANCDFSPKEEKEILATDSFQEALSLEPYSAEMIVLQNKPKEPEKPLVPETATNTTGNVTAR